MLVLAGEADIYVLHILNLSKNLMYLYAIHRILRRLLNLSSLPVLNQKRKRSFSGSHPYAVRKQTRNSDVSLSVFRMNKSEIHFASFFISA
jgi:hypothetical protein